LLDVPSGKKTRKTSPRPNRITRGNLVQRELLINIDEVLTRKMAGKQRTPSKRKMGDQITPVKHKRKC